MSKSIDDPIGLESCHLSKNFQKGDVRVVALDDVSCRFLSHGLNVLLGPSGCGKTTFLNLLSGLEAPDSGEVSLDGKNVLKDNHDIGYVTVESACIQTLSVQDNLYLVTKDEEKIHEILSLLNLEDLSHKPVSLLSRGEQSRTALAVALFLPAKVLLLDEPTANLDRDNTEKVFSILAKLAEEKTVVVATHDEEMARKYGQRILRLQKGKLISVEDSEDVESPDLDLPQAKSRPSVPFSSYAKLAFRKAFSHVPTLLCSSLLLLFSFFGLFLSLSFGLIDQEETLRSTIGELPYPFVRVEDEDIDAQSSPKAQVQGLGFRTISYFPDNGMNYVGRTGFEMTFDEEIEPFMPDIDSLLVLPSSYVSTAEVHYCPIALSQQTIDDLASELGRTPELGDIVDIDLMQDETPIRADFQFVLTGILPPSSDEFFASFPAVMRKEDYDLYLRTEGIVSSALQEGLRGIVNDYFDYCVSQGWGATERHPIGEGQVDFEIIRVVKQSML